jgi:hypothetical protein
MAKIKWLDSDGMVLQISEKEIFILGHTRRFVLIYFTEMPRIKKIFLEICKTVPSPFIHLIMAIKPVIAKTKWMDANQTVLQNSKNILLLVVVDYLF